MDKQQHCGGNGWVIKWCGERSSGGDDDDYVFTRDGMHGDNDIECACCATRDRRRRGYMCGKFGYADGCDNGRNVEQWRYGYSDCNRDGDSDGGNGRDRYDILCCGWLCGAYAGYGEPDAYGNSGYCKCVCGKQHCAERCGDRWYMDEQ